MKDAIKMMESNMSPEAVRRAHIKAEQDIMTIRLAQLREEQNVKQSEMANFTQSSVSKIEKRKDIKISTLIDYLDSLGMGLEIITYPKMADSKKQEKKKAVKILRKYRHITELNKTIVDEFFDKILVGKIDKKTRSRNVEIFWNLEF